VIGQSAPVVPGQWIDDSMRNGALIGAGVGSAVLLIDVARHCGTSSGQAQCTARGTREALEGGAFRAAVGALVDAAIPKRARGGAGSMPDTSRRLSLAFSARFQRGSVRTSAPASARRARRLVSLNFASLNRVAPWLRAVNKLRRARASESSSNRSWRAEFLIYRVLDYCRSAERLPYQQ
jgi:hypothetical protein